jgi:N-acetylglutamate synthase-like GNAT family acetyltransferase
VSAESGLRVAEDDDSLAAANIIAAAEEEAGRHCDMDLLERELEALASAYRRGGGEFWVLLRRGAVCGCVGIRPGAEGGGELRHLCLSPQLRGLGLGRTLARTAIEHAYRSNLHPVWARVPVSATEARNLLCSLGLESSVEGDRGTGGELLVLR